MVLILLLLAIQKPQGGEILNFLMKYQSLPEVNELLENTDSAKDEEILDKACKKSEAEMSNDDGNSVNRDHLPGFNISAQCHYNINYDLTEFMVEKKLLMRKKTLPDIMRMLKKLTRKSQVVNESPVLEGLEDRIGTVTVDDASEWSNNKIIDSLHLDYSNGNRFINLR